ncbi:MAG: MBL fold metallo-hydrolase [Rhodobacter sp.]|uniref:MBL fold metallo-hydrolase n=1 Tax=Pararhodobacter sp. TaxID=2127056 RepID=UPI002BA66D13|nr:MBL fold metallo-hydrolase [Pararhodobacter sp.]MCC0073951.1 MBL fold metallo-hydrolase [Rhodobacter sp.]HPD91339.1 MBL fold metallo-hydrolase [Pararhodobacter sp.]
MTRIATRTVGAAEVTILTDGGIDFGTELFPGTLPDHIAALMRRQHAASIATNFNAVLIREAGRTVLCDAGPRDLFGPTCGFLPQAMAEAGLDPVQVDTLFATHLHPDHIAGMITPQGAAVFPNAELVVTRAEQAFWADEAATGAMPDPLPDWAALARAVLAAYGDRLRLIGPEDPIAPGLTAMPLAGHTPGHSGWRLSSGDGHLIHGGDIIHAPVLQAADPNIAIAFDLDMDTARATRKRLLDELATDGALFTGGHYLRPAFHVAVRDGDGYRLERP